MGNGPFQGFIPLFCFEKTDLLQPLALTFPKSVRLTLSSEFLRVKTEGRSYSGRYMILGILKNIDTETTVPTRTGLITSRRVGGAVVRNRVRRRLREIVRLNRPALVSNAWLVVIARHTAANASFDELQAEWSRLARKAGLLTPSETPSSSGTTRSEDREG
jgi:ribonuclease P protein component